jgi:hypothetical protein
MWNVECGMWDVEYGVMYGREKKELIRNFFIDCMKIETNQWDWEKIVVV